MLHFNESNQTKVIYDHETFTGIKKIGFYDNSHFAIHLFGKPMFDDEERRSETLSSIGISPKEWRKSNPTKAGYKLIAPTHLVIFNDRGDKTSLQIEDEIIIQQLIDECKSHDLIAY